MQPITAARAAQLAIEGKRRAAKAAQAQAKRDAIAYKKNVKWWMQNEMPKLIEKMNKQITEASSKGEKRTVLYSNPSLYREVTEHIEKYLKRKGFHTSTSHRQFQTDYGDTEAPCVMDETATEIVITW